MIARIAQERVDEHLVFLEARFAHLETDDLAVLADMECAFSDSRRNDPVLLEERTGHSVGVGVSAQKHRGEIN